MPILRRKLLSALTLTLGCCDGEAGPGPSNADAGTGEELFAPASLATVEGFGEAFVRATCENLFACRLGYDDASGLRAVYGNRESCQPQMAYAIGDGSAPFLAGIELAKYTYQPEHAAACLKRMVHQCFLFEAEEPSAAFETICAGVFEGDVPVDGTCKEDIDCVGDSYCDTLMVFDMCQRGTCRPRVARGAPCHRSRECQVGENLGVTCTGDDKKVGVCAAATHLMQRGAGEPCGALIENDEVTLALCAAGLVCGQDPVKEDAGSCQRPPGAGQDCTRLRECADGAFCSALASEGRLCIAVTLHEEGEACTKDSEQESASSVRFCRGIELDLTYCDETGHCARTPKAAEGESCAEFDCAPGLYCQRGIGSVQERCAPLLQNDELCTREEACASGNCQQVAGSSDRRCMPDPCE